MNASPTPNLAHTHDFLEFNFSELADPDLAFRVSTRSLYGMIYCARAGSKAGYIEFCDAFAWTVKPACLEAFQRACGPRPITFEDWAYSKVAQFLAILTYEELRWNSLTGIEGEARTNPLVKRSPEEGNVILGATGAVTDADELRSLFPWPRIIEFNWQEVFANVLAAGSNYGDALRSILDEQPSTRQSQPRRRWARNERRDNIIVELLERGDDHEAICRELDNRVIPVLPKLAQHGVHRWYDGYGHPDCQNAIQQLFSKVRNRRKPVNP